MKKILLTAAVAFAALGSFAQGYVNFANDTTSYISNIVTGARVVTGPTFLAQLFYNSANSTEASLVQVSNAPVNFGLPGRVTAGGRFLDAGLVAGGATGTFQIRAWQAALGANWVTALDNYLGGDPAYAGMVLGKSAVVQVKTADGGAAPLPTPAPITGTGLTSFYLTPVPEPSVIALGALGLAAVLWRRRK